MKTQFISCLLLYILHLSKLVTGKEDDEKKDKIRVPIHKLCSLGKVLTFPKLECKDVVLGQNWAGFIYDISTLKRMDSSSFEPNYVFAPKDPQCKNGDWNLLVNPQPSQKAVNESMSKSSSSYSKGELIQSKFILLTNGQLMWRGNKCSCGKCEQWIPLHAQFFVDGLGSLIENGSNAHYSGQESHQILYYCTGEMNDAKLYNLRNDKVFVVILFITAFIYLITVLIYGVLWNCHTLPGRVLLSVVLSRMIMTFMLGLGYVGKVNRWDISSTPVSWCLVIAVCIHYFMISSYSWVAVLNYDLWWTFRFVRPSSEQKSINKHYLCYSCFAWGGPLLLTGVSVIIDSVYKHRSNINHKLVPNYGNGICFIVDCAYGIYVHVFTAIFLIPALLFAILTFSALYKFRKETASVRDAKHGEQQSSFQLYLKLLVIMSVSWTIGHVVWYFHVENDGTSGFYIRNNVLLILHWGIDLVGTSVFILIVFGCSRANLTKLEQNYKIFYFIFERFRQFKKSNVVNKPEEESSSTPLMQGQTRSTSDG